MGLFDALENFAINLPSALDDLKELRRDFRKTFGELALEGAELFTLGFEEMVVKGNADWKTSEENRSEARRIALGARDQHSELAQRYENAKASIEGGWESLDKKREECWDALQELDSLLPLEDRPQSEGKAPWPNFTGIIHPATGLPSRAVGGKPAQPRWELPSTLPSAGLDADEILELVEYEAYRRTFQKSESPAEACNNDSNVGVSLQERVNAIHRRSLEELSAAQAHAEDIEAVKALAAWECEQLEPIAELVKRVAMVYRAGGMYCMAKATEVERCLEEEPPQEKYDENLRERFRATLDTAKTLADLLSIPMVEKVNGLPAASPAFIEQLRCSEALVNGWVAPKGKTPLKDLEGQNQTF